MDSALCSARSLYETCLGLQDREKAICELEDQMLGLVSVLLELKRTMGLGIPISAHLRQPIDRCGQLCGKFRLSVLDFGSSPEARSGPEPGTVVTGLGRSPVGAQVDWQRLQVMGGDIIHFIGIIEEYKDIISVSLGTSL